LKFRLKIKSSKRSRYGFCIIFQTKYLVLSFVDKLSSNAKSHFRN
jgi:hypothetical protein